MNRVIFNSFIGDEGNRDIKQGRKSVRIVIFVK